MKYLAIIIILLTPILATYVLQYLLGAWITLKDFCGALQDGWEAQQEYDKFKDEELWEQKN